MPTYTFTVTGASLNSGFNSGLIVNDVVVRGTITSVSNTSATSIVITEVSSLTGTGALLEYRFVELVGNDFAVLSGYPAQFNATTNPIEVVGYYNTPGSGNSNSLLNINVNGFVFILQNKALLGNSNNAEIRSGSVTIIGEGNGGGGLVCFVEGTRLLTQNGYKAIDTLTSGDLLQTTENRSISFQLSRIQVACTTKATAPYVVAVGALGENIPSVPLYILLAHKFSVRDNIWVHASKGHTLGLDIKQCPVGKAVTYYHVRCDNYARDVILAEGVATESLANKTEDSITFKKTDKVGVFLRNDYKEPMKSLKA